jgi:glycosyltransferase involved in cell wall biosynthesis
MKYSVIIPTLSNHKNFLKCFNSIYETTDENTELIIAYNGEENKFPEMAEKIKNITNNSKRVIPLKLKPFGGISKTCNEAYKFTNGSYISYVHDDVIIYEKNWQNKLSNILDKYNEIGMIGGSEAKYIDRGKEETQKIKLSEENYIQECDWSPTISMTKKEYMEMGCMFDEFYLCGLEDKDWALSFRRIGKKVFFYHIKHKHIGNQGSYSLFKENLNFLSYYSREGPRERYFLDKNKDILRKEYYQKEFSKWEKMDRNIKKSWWKKLYITYYFNLIKRFWGIK